MDLQREIALALGYEYAAYKYFTYDCSEDGTVAVTQSAFEAFTSPDGEFVLREKLPDWENDITCASELLQVGDIVTFRRTANGWGVSNGNIRFYAPTLASAISQHWLERHRAGIQA